MESSLTLWRLVLLVLGAGVFLAASAEPGFAQEAYVVRESADPCVNVRPEPTTDAEPFRCLAPGVQVTVIESVPYWREIRLADGTVGWAAKKFLEPTGTVASEPAPTPIPADAWLEIHFVDVGHGDGIWITTHDDGVEGNGIFEGRSVVIDGGPRRVEDTNEMLHYLLDRAHQGAVIDALIVTHPHTDHFPGAQGLLPFFEVRRIYDPGFPKEGTMYETFLTKAEQETALGEPVNTMIGREEFDGFDYLGNELTAEVLYSYPGPEIDPLLGEESTLENNASIVLRLAYGDHVFLFMGDAEGKHRDQPDTVVHFVEELLLDSLPPEKLEADVLKAGHHGSETSSTTPFIEAVDPEVVLILAGRRSFGGSILPDESVLERFCELNPEVRIYRTDHRDAEEGHTGSTAADGDHVVIRTNGDELEAMQFSNGEPAPDPACPTP